MNISFLLQALLVNSSCLFPELPPEITKLLGHSVIVSPYAHRVLPKVDFPHFLAGFGDVVETEVTGAVIAGEAPEDLKEQIGFLRSQKGWMTRAMVVIVASMPNKWFFAYLWKRKIMNTLWFTGSGLYTYSPFNDTIIALDGRDIEKKMDARWKDLQGYKVPIALYLQNLSFSGTFLGGGIDGSAVFELAKYWNMTLDLKFTEEDDHDTLRSNQMLVGDKAAIAMNARFMIPIEKKINVEYTTSIYGDSWVVALKMPTRVLRSCQLARILTGNVWLGMFGTAVLMNRAFLYKAKKNRSIYSARLSTRSSELHYPTRKRLFQCCGVLIRLLMVTIFQASLLYFLKPSDASNEIETLSEVLQAHKNLLTNSWIVKKNFRTFRNLKSKPVPVVIDTLSDELFDKNPVAIRYKELQLMMEGGLLKKDLYLLKEELWSYAMVYVVKRGSPFLKPLSDFTSRSFESGLSEKWYRLTSELTSENKRNIYPPAVEERKEKHIAIAFLALFVVPLDWAPE